MGSGQYMPRSAGVGAVKLPKLEFPLVRRFMWRLRWLGVEVPPGRGPTCADGQKLASSPSTLGHSVRPSSEIVGPPASVSALDFGIMRIRAGGR